MHFLCLFVCFRSRPITKPDDEIYKSPPIPLKLPADQQNHCFPAMQAMHQHAPCRPDAA